MASLSDPLVRQLLNGRYIATLATHNPDQSIHMVAVWYHFEGERIYVATSSRSRKLRNLQSAAQVSFMVDSRDPAASCGFTLEGTAKILIGEISHQWNARVHSKYLSDAALKDEKVGPVFAAWDDVTIEIHPHSLFSWDMREADRQVFGSAFQKNPTYLLAVER